MHRIWFVAILVLVAAAWTWWLTGAEEEKAAPRSKIAFAPTLDYYVAGLNARIYDGAGRVTRSLSAQRMQHLRATDSTELLQPRLRLIDPEGPEWLVSADKGAVSEDGTLIALDGRVDIRRSVTDEEEALWIQTPTLNVRPKEKYAETDAAVHIERGPDRVDSLGMQAWFAEPTHIKLLSQVRGLYVPRE
jgi:lipopolysaccharide export system protein LptC